MYKSNNLLFNFNCCKNQSDFIAHKFTKNNIRILILSVFLSFEQLYYALIVREHGSILQKIHYFSAAVMIIYAFISLYYHYNKPAIINKIHQIYIYGFPFLGVLIAVIRCITIENHVFRLPTIFIAVIYGLAVIFYLNPFESFLLYFLANIALIHLLPIYHPTVVESSFVEDCIANTMIAWIISMINYRNFVKEFINQKLIENNNEELNKKNVQIQEMNLKLKDISIKDGLTNIYNRRKLDQVLHNEYIKAQNSDYKFSIILLDIDMFKSINDTYGHKTGDTVLIEIANILKKDIGNNDIVGRWGGEEFLIICSNTDIKYALKLSEKLRKAIGENKFKTIKQSTGSFGVTSYCKGDSIDDIINRADAGLYKAKKYGRNKVEAIS